MIRSVLSRPVRLVQHAALGAAHLGLNTAASVLSKVKPGSQDGSRSGGSRDAGTPSAKAAPPVDRGGDSRATPPTSAQAPASAKKPEAAKKPAPAKKTPAAKKPESAKKAPAAKKPEPATTSSAKKPEPATKSTAKKPAPAKTSTAKKSPAKKSSAEKAAASVTPADLAARVAPSADDKEHVEVEEVLAYSAGPDVTTTVGDEVSDGSTS